MNASWRTATEPAATAPEDALALRLASHSRALSMTEIAGLYGWTPETRHRLRYLLLKGRAKGTVIMEGERRHARWSASAQLRSSALREQLAAPLDKRPRVGYAPEFLAEYRPNQTFYLTQAQRQKLASRCAPGEAVFNALSPHDQSLFLCGLSFASSSLEGNCYDLAATERLLLEGLEKQGATPA
ncbi:MAG TPA: hypothetical protein VN259_17210, partial [Xanthomonadales bacterium]|nr:hypothetical protein [Xanthomonadales bacterium]